MNRMNVAVLLGGWSAEREISLSSGQAVAEALRERGHIVVEIDPAEDTLNAALFVGCDVVFIALHGEFGEDGQVQQQLEKWELAYTGSGPESSSIAFSKIRTKEVWLGSGIAVPRSLPFAEESFIEVTNSACKELGFPVVVKPDRQGSSIGVRFAGDRQELEAAINHCLEYDSQGLIEEAISGTEWSVSVVDDLVLPPVRIDIPAGFYDYAAKYQSSSTRYEVTERADGDVIVQAALLSYRSLNARGLARVDLIVDHSGKPWMLELNTIPGMTLRSLAPMAARHQGWTFGEFCEHLCGLAM